MDMPATHQDQLVFHLTGRRHGDGLAPADGLMPALFAPYRRLDELRHDFPLVLVERGPQVVQTLSAIVDAVLKDVAPRGVEGERLRRHALQLETELRRASAAGVDGRLSEEWAEVAAALGQRDGETLEQVLIHAGSALPADGALVGCAEDMPAAVVTHAWKAARRTRAKAFHAELSRLVLKLSDILRAAYAHSQAGLQPASLKAAVGAAHQGQFDFDALARIVGKGAPRDELPAARRARLMHALGVLEAQRFVAPPDADDDEAGVYHGYVFADCASAATAYRERLDELAELVKAMAVADLEVRGAYVEAEHDLFFDAFGRQSLTADDLARFPDYLVCIPADRNAAPENAALMEMLSSGMPVKALVQVTELLEDASIGTGQYAFGVRSARLATTAMGLGGMFVMQCAASNLFAMRDGLVRGLGCRGPALFCVFTPPPAMHAALPAYLTAAAAMQSRAFPAFVYDAAAGRNWAERFSLANNPQPDGDWPVESLTYADDARQTVRLPLAFTFADFVLCDERSRDHFARVPRARWNDAMIPAADWLALDDAEATRRVPYILAVDGDDALHRVIVDARLMQSARRCLLLWRRLQEHGGIHDSHAERLLAREKAAWAATAAPAAPAAASSPAPAPAAEAAAVDSAPPAHSRDEAWIDTDRCPSCNECQLINDRMFSYNERKQAFIKDLAAGTYRQLVEAAESCQVAIIHPGKPRDPNEPGLEELLKRAEPFR